MNIHQILKIKTYNIINVCIYQCFHKLINNINILKEYMLCIYIHSIHGCFIKCCTIKWFYNIFLPLLNIYKNIKLFSYYVYFINHFGFSFFRERSELYSTQSWHRIRRRQLWWRPGTITHDRRSRNADRQLVRSRWFLTVRFAIS